MSVSSINSSTSIQQLYNYSNSTNLSKNIGQTEEKSQGDALRESINIVSSVAQKYDVKNITPREMAQMSQELYDNNSISLKNHAFMSFGTGSV